MANVTMLAITAAGALFMGGSVVANAGTPYGPPGWNTAPDPCRNCQMPSHTQLPDNRRQVVKPPPPPNPTRDPDVQRGINGYKRP
jgi:hypothetical protein